MGITFTPEQQKVIDLHQRNILVSAAAGSGKTAVLVERIIRLICDEAHPVDIDRLLILTFTNAAAAEMRERISLGITRQLALNPESEHIQRQATLLHNAQITTIDSFCMFLLRNHFNEIGVDPAFRVMDEGEKKLMQQDVMKEMLEEKFADKDQAFLDCVEYFCPGGREQVLEGYILSLHQFSESYPWPQEWLKERKKDYEEVSAVGLEETDYVKYLKEHIHSMLEGCLETCRRIQDICQEPDGPYMYGELADQELEQIESLLTCDTLEEYASRIPAVTYGRLPSKKDDSVSPDKRELAKKLRNQVKDTLKDMGGRFFATPLCLAAEQAGACAGPVGMLVDLALEFGRRMREQKREKNLVDFSDMEHYALEILLERDGGQVRPSQVALEYRQHFVEILIDEYQDSNLVQEFLLKAVSGEEDGYYNRFMVGDVKQSIYKFRLARPDLFLEKYHTYTQEDGPCQRIDLAKNFRSRREVVDTVNGVFSRMMNRRMGGIEYDESATLYPGASYPENPGCQSELILVEKPGSAGTAEAAGKTQEVAEAGRGHVAGKTQEVAETGAQAAGKTQEVAETGRAQAAAMTPKRAEAAAIAGRIKELRASFQVTDKETGQLRPVQYRDIVILMRTTSGWDEDFKAVLEDEGIPVYITSKTGYFAASEVQQLLQLLRVLDNPRQDIPLYGVMKSRFGGFSEEEIALLRSMDRKKSLYEVLVELKESKEQEAPKEQEVPKRQEVPEELKGQEVPEAPKEQEAPDCESAICSQLRQNVLAFLEKIERWRSYTVYMPIRGLLQQILNESGYLHYVAALPAGSKRRANVEMLLTKASDFEKTSYHGLFHFIRYMEQLEKYDVDYGEAELLDENADVVRIMSIHKSKGLEFPVTIVAGLNKRFNMQDANQTLIVDMDMGIGTDYVNPQRRVRNRTLRRLALARKMREDNLAEEMRVLYVAMTRPKEKLILTATVENAAQKWEQQRQMGTERLYYNEFIEAGSYLDFLLPVIGQANTDVRIVDPEAFLGGRTREQVRLLDRRQRLERAGEYSDPDRLRLLEESFSFRYPYDALKNLYTKTTVSELKIAAMALKDEAAFHTFEEQEVVPYIPLFRRGEEKVSGAVRGNAFHKVMELMDFEAVYRGLFQTAPGDYKAFAEGVRADGRKKEESSFKGGLTTLGHNLKELLAREVAEKRLPDEYRQAVNDGKLLHFLESELAFRMWRADRDGKLFREQPFVYAISAGRLGEQFPEEEKVLIQGIIDAYFIEEGKVVLVDYKTDVVKSAAELWNRYETQLQYYEEALKSLTQLPVGRKILYSFYMERCVEE